MSFEFATVAADLAAYLKPLLPTAWKVLDSGAPLGQTSGVVLTYTQGNASATLEGVTMPNGSLGIDFVLVLSAPETDPVKGFKRVNAAAPYLFRALDRRPDLQWETAERGVLDTGETIYIIPIQVIATYNTQE